MVYNSLPYKDSPTPKLAARRSANFLPSYWEQTCERPRDLATPPTTSNLVNTVNKQHKNPLKRSLPPLGKTGL
ncbi:hypothetical protein VN97_g2332 [Penicillium thymicola]|uniref:Uncharacterized protein n=1 Tax=Penicillium thymicola TaxID=293382 RepID=A0AAI9TPF9_PENTH|nr:hypothetical protein VN97_g2332 [Penicillium thymicola]